MNLDLQDKVAVITGGSRGIGLATVKLLISEGMHVVTASRRLTDELTATSAVPVTVDLTTEDGPQRLVNEAISRFGGIDVLVNNVGIGDTDDVIRGATHDLATLPDEAWQHTFDLHFYTALRATRAALPSLLARHGVVINVSSAGARIVSAGPADYNVAKAALNALTKVISEQYAAQGVRAITISPGPVSTRLWTDPDAMIGRLAQLQGSDHATFAAQLMDSLGAATGRLSTPEEVARAIAFAASPNNITGNELLVDGGIVKNL
jgi:NAD(P)-dependent dehydrogenase (short-subunit alcohol dehydrogenase family)